MMLPTPALAATFFLQLAFAQTFRGMTWNLRWDSMQDNVTIAESIAALKSNSIQTPLRYYPDTNERPWSQRRIPVANQVLFNEVSLLGFEEAVVRQVNDMQTLLGPEWDHRGVSRADGTDDNASGSFDNEFGPVFWKKSLLQLVSWDTFWLSDTPFDVATKAPMAGNPRICTTAKFQAQSGLVTVMVTHWDDQSDEAREIGASLILHRANHEALTTQRPVLLFGDFNSVAVNLTTPNCNSCTNGAYLIITGASPPLPINETFARRFPVPSRSPRFTMTDLRIVTPKEHISGDFATYTGFDPVSDTDDFKRIDFIMGGSNGGWTSNTYRVGSNIYDDGLYLSDHRPVYSDITLEHGKFPV